MTIKKLALLFALMFMSSNLFAEQTHNRFLGKTDAPITLYEFASLACVHCASFFNNEFPKIKEKYIDTGKVKIVFMDIPFGGGESFLLAHATLYQTKNSEDFFKLASIYFKNQSKLRSPDSVKVYAKLMGLSDKDIKNAENEKLQKSLMEEAKKYLQNLQIEGTPTLFIVKTGEKLTKSSTKLVGAQSFSIVEKAINKALN